MAKIIDIIPYHVFCVKNASACFNLTTTHHQAQIDRSRMPSCCIAETNLSTVLAVAKLAGSHQRRMKRRQKTHPPFYINSTGGRQKSITTSEDELTPQHSMTGSTNKQINDFFISLSHKVLA